MINFAIKLAATVAVEALQVGLQASRRTKGPRLDELTLSTAEYGTPLPRFLGARRFACQVFHAEDLKEVEKTSKVKGGGKQTTYHYLATFACAIADNAIDRVLKIFFDDKLVYDATGVGPMSYASTLGIDLNSVMRIYLGTDDQMPDPRYSSWCEDRYGPDSAPAYRGVSYLFFEELPVDNFGNRIPQISVEAVSATQVSHPYEAKGGAGSGIGGDFSPDGLVMYQEDTTTLFVWDVPSRTLITKREDGPFGALAPAPGGLYTLGGGFVPSSKRLWLFDAAGGGGSLLTPAGFSTYTNGMRYVAGSLLFYPVTTNETYYGLFDGLDVTAFDIGYASTHFFEGPDGSAWSVGVDSITEDNLNVRRLSPDVLAPSGSQTTAGGAAFGMWNGEGGILVWQAGELYLLDAEDPSIVLAGPVAHSVALTYASAAFNAVPPGSARMWIGFSEIDTRALAVLRTVDPADWVAQTMTGGCYDVVNNALVTHTFGTDEITWRYLDRGSNAGITLGAIVAKMCDAAGLTDRDTSLLTQTVAGYSWTRGDVKSQMEPVLDIHDVDARGHDFAIQFLPRGSAPSGTVLTKDFAKSGKESPRYKVTIQQDTDLPRILRVNFADTGFDQQTNNVLSPLPADTVDTQRDQVVDLTTYAASPDEAQQLADRYIRREWNSREQVENALTAQCLAFEPGDVKTLDLDGITQNARLIKQTLVGGRIDCTFVRDETSFAAVNSATTGPPMDGRDPDTITIPGPIRGFVIDAPYRWDSDQDVRPQLYAAAGGYAGLGFPGAAIYEATGSGTSLAYDQLFAGITGSAAWGSCSGALGGVASPWLWDRGNTLRVTLQNGSLTSVTESDIDGDAELNLILVGRPGNWEYIQFTTATLNGDGSYTLSGFKRGRRGTEWACSGHADGEVWIFARSLDLEDMGSDDLGDSLSFKAQAIGRAVDAASAIDIDPFSGATLKPYAPASIAWSWDGTNLTGTITRRTRIGGAWVGGSTIPLSENSEAYEVDVYNGATFKRTIGISGTNVFTYTAAMAAADGITLPTPPTVNVYQLSDSVGRGYALAA
jgi:hypothetical protein